ncbi:MAG: hypothetical protein AAF694_21585 [Bacteroidota bacterium]
MKTSIYWAGVLSSLTMIDQVVNGQSLTRDECHPFADKRAHRPHYRMSDTQSASIRYVEDSDHPHFVVEAYFCAAHNTDTERRILEASLDFWNGQSGRFGYKIQVDGKEQIIPVYFHLNEAAGIYDGNGFFLPAGRVNSSLLTYLFVVPDKRLRKLDKLMESGRAVGFAAPNAIYISDEYVDSKTIGLHEMGHILGAKHVKNSIMDTEVSLLIPKVRKKTIRQILAKGGIPVKGLKRNRTHHQDASLQYAQVGKIVKQKQHHSQPNLAFVN